MKLFDWLALIFLVAFSTAMVIAIAGQAGH